MTDWITTHIDSPVIRGAIDLERTSRGVMPHRLPAWARAQISDEYFLRVESQPSGVRLTFRTRATELELTVLPTKMNYLGNPQPPGGLYDLTVDGQLFAQSRADGGNLLLIDPATQRTTFEPGPVGTVRFHDLITADKLVEIWLPQTETTELISLRTNAPVLPGTTGDRKAWLHHGSSISHGSTASSPSTTWPAIVAARAGSDLINLGFSGNALLDPFVARAIRDTPADFISLKIGINLANHDLFRRRALAPAVHGFLDTIRDGHPDLPLLLISPLYCGIQEETPGPIAPIIDEKGMRFQALGDGSDPTKLTLQRIREEFEAVVAQRTANDPNLRYLDGRVLFGEADAAELPLPDGLHPSPAGHQRIAERFTAAVLGASGLNLSID